MSEAAVEPGMGHERVGMFADAVFAIAMTLLVVEIPRPPDTLLEGDEPRLVLAARLWDFLGGIWGTFLAFLIAFLILWGVWRGHHRTLDMITRGSRRVMFRHIPLLIVVVLLPYTTGLIGGSARNPLAVCLFAVSVAALLFAQAGLLRAIVRDGVLRPGIDGRGLLVEAFTLTVTGMFWLLTAGLTWTADWVPLLWLLGPLVGVVSGRAARRRLRPAP